MFPVVKTVTESGEKRQEGLELLLTEAVAASLNAPLEVDTPTDGGYWGRDEDGDGLYDGLVGDLQSRRVDVGFSQLFIKRDRTDIMDFSQAYDYEYTCFLTLRPREPQFKALVKPFSQGVWYENELL